jgi:hypothetical protein
MHRNKDTGWIDKIQLYVPRFNFENVNRQTPIRMVRRSLVVGFVATALHHDLRQLFRADQAHSEEIFLGAVLPILREKPIIKQTRYCLAPDSGETHEISLLERRFFYSYSRPLFLCLLLTWVYP